MSTTNILMAAAGAITAPSLGSWIAKLDTASTLDSGRSIALDTLGNVYVTGQAVATTAANSYIFIAKYNSNGVIQWNQKLETSSSSDIGNSLAVDASGNVYVTGITNIGNTTSFIFVAKYNSSGIIKWQQKLDTPTVGDASYSIAVDTSGNSYITGQTNNSTVSGAFIIKYDTSGNLQWQKRLDARVSTPVQEIGYNIALDSSNNIYITGIAGATTGQYIFIIKCAESGDITWQKTLDTATNADTGYAIALDSAGNSYIVGQANSTTAANSFVIVAKYDTSGVNQWQRSLDVTSNLDVGYGIAVDSTGSVYVIGQANATTVANSYIFIAKYDTSGNIQWRRKLDSAATDIGYSITVDSTGYMYLTGQILTGANGAVIVAKLPSDGSIPGTGSYTVGGTVITYSDVSATLNNSTTPGLVDASGNFILKPMNKDCWAATPGTATAATAKSLFRDSSGNLVVSFTSLETYSGGIQKYNSSGISQWYKQLYGGSAVVPNSIITDASDNVIFTGTGNGTANRGTVLTIKYDAVGAVQWAKNLGDASVSAAAQYIVSDSSGNLYLVGSQDTNTLSNVLIVKYNSAGVVQWKRNLGISGTSDIGYSIAIDSSSNIYITGVANSSTTANAYIFIAKYNSAGAVQWRRKLETASQYDSGNAIVSDSAGNVYVTGQANNTTNAYMFVAKYDTNGNIQWRRKLEITSQLDLGTAITLDSSGNVFVTGQVNASTSANSYIIIVKYNSNGVIQWQNTLDRIGASDKNAGIVVDNTGFYYLYLTSGTGVLLIKLPSDGSICAVYFMEYNVGTLSETDATSILTDSDVSTTLLDSISTVIEADALGTIGEISNALIPSLIPLGMVDSAGALTDSILPNSSMASNTTIL